MQSIANHAAKEYIEQVRGRETETEGVHIQPRSVALSGYSVQIFSPPIWGFLRFDLLPSHLFA